MVALSRTMSEIRPKYNCCQMGFVREGMVIDSAVSLGGIISWQPYCER